MIGGRLTMRALVERDQATAADSWSQKVAPDFQPVGDPLPCFAWSNASSEIKDGQKVAMREDLRVMVSLAADLRADDEISSITDRKGVEIIPGRLQVIGPPERKHTHIEADLRRIG